jgi:hypothetical protein
MAFESGPFRAIARRNLNQEGREKGKGMVEFDF